MLLRANSLKFFSANLGLKEVEMKSWSRLLVYCVTCFLSTGCAAGKIYVAQSGDNQSSCLALKNELKLAQAKIQTLKDTDHSHHYDGGCTK